MTLTSGVLEKESSKTKLELSPAVAVGLRGVDVDDRWEELQLTLPCESMNMLPLSRSALCLRSGTGGWG